MNGYLPCGAFGFSVASAGDVNGDHHEDLIIGAPFGDFDRGAAYIYLGGSTPPQEPDLRLVGNGNSAHFGIRVASAGDFNADGFGDVIVSAGSPIGAFYVYLGGASPDSIPAFTLHSPPGFFEPAGVASADVNGDGYSDIVVGFAGSPSRVFVYFGGPAADAVPDLELKAIPSDLSASMIATTDLDGDGYADVILGSTSGIRVYHGGPALDGNTDLQLAGPNIEGEDVLAFTPAGDVNGDESQDLMVSTQDGDGKPDRVYLFFGGSHIGSGPELALHGVDPSDSFGQATTSLGDVNGDGRADILIGATHADGSGSAYLFLGGAPMDTTPAAVVTNARAAGFSYSLGAADVSGDGILEGLVSMPFGVCTNGTSGPPGEVFCYDFALDLSAKAFVQGPNRTIPLGRGYGVVAVRFEPIGGSYENTEVNMSTITLVSDASGEARRISAEPSKEHAVSDLDGDGVPELRALFSVPSLRNVLGAVSGRAVVQARLEGALTSGRRLGASVTLTVLGVPKGDHTLGAMISPNPINPAGILQFALTEAGPVSLRVFDARGELVRTVLASEPLTAGTHSVMIDGRDARGRRLASGTYFFAIQSPTLCQRGRFVIAK